MLKDFKKCFEKNLLIFLPVGFFSGLPLLLTSATLGTWLADIGINKTTIGIFALVGIPYALKFLWAPILDASIFGSFSAKVGRRRSWIIVMEVLIGVNILLMAYVDPIQSTLNLAILAFTLSFFSASHDVAIDAWRIEIHKKSELGLGAAMYVTGYRISLLVAGAGALVIADLYSWKLAFISLASLFPLGILIVGFCNIKENTFNEYKERKSYKSIFTTRVIDPFLDFMRKNNWVLILVFIALFKWGDALLGVLSQPFMLEIGFTKSEIAAVSKVYGLIATLVGLFIGGIIISRLGIIKSLLIAGILQLLSNLVFISLAINGSSIPLLMSTITIENLSGGIGTAAFIAYLSSLCNIRFSAFQYALLSSFMAFSRTWLAAPAGWLIDTVIWIKYLKLIGLDKVNNPEWVGFFIITTLFAIPSLILIYYIKDNKK